MSTRKPAPRRSSGKTKPTDDPSSAGKSLEEELVDLQQWQRWHPHVPQSTGLSRMQQWVRAYSGGVLKPRDDGPVGPSGRITG